MRINDPAYRPEGMTPQIVPPGSLGLFLGDGTSTACPSSPAVAVKFNPWPSLYQERIGRIANPEGKVQRVFYPLAGADLETALAVFSGPRGGPSAVLMVDVLPFGSPEQVLQTFGSKQAKQQFFDKRAATGSSDVGDSTNALTGPAILWQLEALKAEQVQVEYLSNDARPVRPKPRSIDLRLLRQVCVSPNPEAPLSPGLFYSAEDRDVVRVSFEQGGVKKSLVYVQHDALDQDGYPAILKAALAKGVDGVLEKAGLGFSSYPIYQRLMARVIGELGPGGTIVSDIDRSARYRIDPLPISERVDVRFGYQPAAYLYRKA